MARKVTKEIRLQLLFIIRLEVVDRHGMVFREQPSVEAKHQLPLDVYSLMCHCSHCCLSLFHESMFYLISELESLNFDLKCTKKKL